MIKLSTVPLALARNVNAVIFANESASGYDAEFILAKREGFLAAEFEFMKLQEVTT